MKRIAWVVFGCLVVMVSACANLVQERKAYWEQVMNSEVPIGTNRAAIEEWARKRAIRLRYLPGKNQMSGMVESVPVHELFCNSWIIDLEISLNAEGEATNEVVKTLGNCL